MQESIAPFFFNFPFLFFQTKKIFSHKREKIGILSFFEATSFSIDSTAGFGSIESSKKENHSIFFCESSVQIKLVS